MKYIQPFAKQQTLHSSKLKEFADDNFRFDESGRMFSKQVENTKGKKKLLVMSNFSFFLSVFKRLVLQTRKDQGLFGKLSRYLDFEDRIFNRVISDISVVLKKTTVTISDSIETGASVDSEIVRVVSLSTTEITEITRFKNPIFRV